MVFNNFIYQFNKVFTEEFIIKPCGREEVIKLIQLAKSYDNSKNYGNLDTGFMNKDKIITLYNKLIS